MVETLYLNGSVMRRLTRLTPEIQTILPMVAVGLKTLVEDVMLSQTSLILSDLASPLGLPAFG